MDCPLTAAILKQVLDGGQCGGKDFYCKTLVPAVCVDAVWEKASCRPGYTCSRHNASWWASCTTCWGS